MWSTPSSIARRKTARAACGSLGGPKTPGPASCIAPKPMRLTGLSPRSDVVLMCHKLPRAARPNKKPGDHVTLTTRLRSEDSLAFDPLQPVRGRPPLDDEQRRRLIEVGVHDIRDLGAESIAARCVRPRGGDRPTGDLRLTWPLRLGALDRVDRRAV